MRHPGFDFTWFPVLCHFSNFSCHPSLDGVQYEALLPLPSWLYYLRNSRNLPAAHSLFYCDIIRLHLCSLPVIMHFCWGRNVILYYFTIRVHKYMALSAIMSLSSFSDLCCHAGFSALGYGFQPRVGFFCLGAFWNVASTSYPWSSLQFCC